MATLSEKLQVILEAVGGSTVINDFEKVGRAAQKAYGDTSAGAKDAAAGTGIFDRAASSVSGKLKTLGVDANVTGGMLKTGVALGASVAGAAALKFGADSVHAFADATGSVRAFQRVSGATAEDSSKLVSAMKQLGVDSDAGATSVFRLARNVADHADKLAADNIQIAKNAQGNTDVVGTLLNVADAYNATQDPAQKAKIVFDAFGRSGAQMIPILQRGRQGLKDLFAEAGQSHQIFSQDDLEKGRQFSLATKQLGETFKGLEIEVGSGLVPQLTAMASDLTSIIHVADSLASHVGGLGEALHNLGGAGTPAFAGLSALSDLTKGHFSDALLNSTGLAGHFAKSIFGIGDSSSSAKDKTAALAEATQAQADAASQAADANQAEEKAIDGVINASVAAVNSTLGLERATASETTAVADYNAKLAANTAAHGLNTDAAKALQDATLSTKEAMVNEAGAAVKLAQDQATAAGQTLSAHDAAQIFHDKLLELAGTIQGPLHDQLINLANTVNTLPDKQIQVILNTSGIAGQINYINSQLNGIAAPDRVFGGGGVGFKAEGGLISSATLAVVGEAGPELILPLTKPARMAELLSQANLLKPFGAPLMAGGGRGGESAATIVNLNVSGSVVSEGDLVSRILAALQMKKVRGTALNLS